jgi:hypothetical protein
MPNRGSRGRALPRPRLAALASHSEAVANPGSPPWVQADGDPDPKGPATARSAAAIPSMCVSIASSTTTSNLVASHEEGEPKPSAGWERCNLALLLVTSVFEISKYLLMSFVERNELM